MIQKSGKERWRIHDGPVGVVDDYTDIESAVPGLSADIGTVGDEIGSVSIEASVDRETVRGAYPIAFYRSGKGNVHS